MKTENMFPMVMIVVVLFILPVYSQDLYDEIRQGHLENVKTLIERDPGLLQTRHDGIYPLHQAVRFGNKEIAEFLVSKGADINKFAVDASGFSPFENTPLTEAIRYKNFDMIKMFVDNGADLKKVTSLGESYLHFAVFMNGKELAEFFIDNGIDVNIKKQGDLTPLHIAAIFGFDDMVEMLVDRGAELNAESTDGGTPLHFARAAGKTATAELLISRGTKDVPRNFPKYSGEYLGIKKPGSTPEPFAPELFRNIYRAHSTPEFSSDGKEVYWECIFMRGNNEASRIWFMKEENGRWTPPRIAPFSEYPSGGPAFFHDGNRLVYFSFRPRDNSGRPAGDLDLWVVERRGDGWTRPEPLDTPLNQDGSFETYPIIAKDGTIYLNRGPQGFVKSDFIKGKYTAVENIGDLFNKSEPDDCRAMEYIFLFSDRARSERFEYEIYVSYHKPDGTWSKPVYLGDKLHPGRRGTQAVLSKDGQYLFFTSYFSFFWVDAKVIEKMRGQKLK